MRCDECQFYSFPNSQCRANPATVDGPFPKVPGDAWCGAFKLDSMMADVFAIRSVQRHGGTRDYSSGYVQHVAGIPLTAEELAENGARADAILAKRKAR